MQELFPYWILMTKYQEDKKLDNLEVLRQFKTKLFLASVKLIVIGLSLYTVINFILD